MGNRTLTRKNAQCHDSRMRKLAALLTCLFLAGCAATERGRADVGAGYAARCEKQGHPAGSDAWRACIQTEDLNASLATQRAYDQKLLRRLDCIDPRIACSPAAP